MKTSILAATLAGLTLAGAGASAAEFNAIAADKSTLSFVYKQMGVPVDGRFKKFAAQIEFRSGQARRRQGRASTSISPASMPAPPRPTTKSPARPGSTPRPFRQAKFVSSARQGAGRQPLRGHRQDDHQGPHPGRDGALHLHAARRQRRRSTAPSCSSAPTSPSAKAPGPTSAPSPTKSRSSSASWPPPGNKSITAYHTPRRITMKQLALLAARRCCPQPPAFAAPETYVIDDNHTFPRFSYSHLGYSTQTQPLQQDQRQDRAGQGRQDRLGRCRHRHEVGRYRLDAVQRAHPGRGLSRYREVPDRDLQVDRR